MGSKNCVPIPQWKNDCGSGYDKNECVHICRDGVMDVYKSLENDNKDEPVKGSRKDNPTWAFRSTCAAMEPNPIVTGPNVVPVLDEVTGVIEYQITPAVDTDTVVTYTFNQTNPVNGDGIIEFTVTPSDGGADQFITLPEPTVDTDTNNDWTASALSPAGILTYTGTDGQGNPIAMPPVDLNALISPMLLAGTGITLDIDPNTGDITVNSTVVDTDTDTWDDVVAVQSTDPNTGVVTTTITVTPAEGGTPVVTTITSSPTVTNQSVSTTNTATTATTTTTLSDGSTASATVPIMQPTCEHTLNRPVYELAYQSDIDSRLRARPADIVDHSNSCFNTVQSSFSSSSVGSRVSTLASRNADIDTQYGVAGGNTESTFQGTARITAFGNSVSNIINSTDAGMYNSTSSNITDSPRSVMTVAVGSEIDGGLFNSMMTAQFSSIVDSVGAGIHNSTHIDINEGSASSYSVALATIGESTNRSLITAPVSLLTASGGRNELLGNIFSSNQAVIGSAHIKIDGLRSATVLSSSTMQPRKQFTVSGGAVNAGAGVVPSAPSGMMWELDSITGDINANGVITANAALPGFGEYALAKKSIPAGSPVIFEGAFGVRLAKKDEEADGVSRDKLVMSAGGGFEPENGQFILDENFEIVMEDREIKVEENILDTEGLAKAELELDKSLPIELDESEFMEEVVIEVEIDGKPSKVKSTQINVKKYSEAVNKRMKEREAKRPKKSDFTSVKVHKDIVNAPKLNPNYKEGASNLVKVGVEMLGRTIMNVSGVKVGDKPNGFRVLEVLDDKRSVVLVK